MITESDNPSLGWIGANPSLWIGAINPLPTDFAIGTFSLTLTNVVVGSAVQIETQAGATVENRVADSTSEVFVLNYYKLTSPYNDLRIKIRKGTATPFYQPYETLVTASVSTVSIYVSQIPDE